MLLAIRPVIKKARRRAYFFCILTGKVYIMGFFILVMENKYDFIVIGAVFSGLSAAMCAARLVMKGLG